MQELASLSVDRSRVQGTDRRPYSWSMLPSSRFPPRAAFSKPPSLLQSPLLQHIMSFSLLLRATGGIPSRRWGLPFYVLLPRHHQRGRSGEAPTAAGIHRPLAWGTRRKPGLLGRSAAPDDVRWSVLGGQWRRLRCGQI